MSSKKRKEYKRWFKENAQPGAIRDRWWHKTDTVKQIAGEEAFLAKCAKKLKRRPTLAEAEFKKKLDYWGIEYIFQWPFYHFGYGGVCDFYLPEYRMAVEVDGGYHLNPDQMERDKIRNTIFLEYMLKPILRLTNQEALEWDNFTVMAMIQCAKYGGRLAA